MKIHYIITNINKIDQNCIEKKNHEIPFILTKLIIESLAECLIESRK